MGQELGRGERVTEASSPIHDWRDFADHMGAAYLRYSFTKGTEQEVAFLWDALGLEPGMRVLDVGCGPGRHSLALARRGADVTGVDIAPRFVELGNEAAQREGLSARFEVGDAQELNFAAQFDAVISLCQGGFGLVGRAADGSIDDLRVLEGIARALRHGGLLALSAFNAYFQVRHLESFDHFDPATGVNTEQTELRDENGTVQPAVLRTACFTPLELRLLLERVGLNVVHLWSVTPGSYARCLPSVDQPEWLVIAQRPG
jgi:SAM-dependent methyltransferase